MAEQLSLRGTLKGHNGWVTQIATTPMFPDMILSSSRDKSIIIWKLTKVSGLQFQILMTYVARRLQGLQLQLTNFLLITIQIQFLSTTELKIALSTKILQGWVLSVVSNLNMGLFLRNHPDNKLWQFWSDLVGRSNLG